MYRILGLGLLGALAAMSQETPLIGTVTTVLTVGNEAIAQRQYLVRASVVYLDTVEADKFVDSAQIALDIQNVLQEFPNRQAPAEAYAAAICIRLMQKYPQLLGASVGFTNANNTLATSAQRIATSAPTTVRSAVREELRLALSPPPAPANR